MAGIDRIRVTSVEQWQEFWNWANNVREDCLEKTGRYYDILDYFYSRDIGEVESWLKAVREGTKGSDLTKYRPSIPATNFPLAIDRYVIQNCSIDWVQERLKDQYISDYKDIKEGRDSFSIPYVRDVGKHLKITYSNFDRNFVGYKKGFRYWIELEGVWEEGEDWSYNEDLDFWVNTCKELTPWTSSVCIFGKSKKALVRKIISWKLPVGTKIKVDSPYCGEIMNIKITK